MNVLIGHFTTESNGNIPHRNDITDYTLFFDQDVLKKSEVDDIFQNYGIQLIPAVYANAGGSGIIKKETYCYLLNCFLQPLKQHLHELDGIFLFLHGASEVEEVGSGDHHILKSIRKIVGPYLPIAVVCDPHGNLCKEYVESTTIIRSFRESPHTDATETKRKTAELFCNVLRKRVHIHSIYRKLPLILGGEQSVSADEPVCTINNYMDEMEKDPRILSTSWHVGYIRHDTPVAGCGIVVVPASENDIEYCEKKANELAQFVWDKRHEFHYTGFTASPEYALELSLTHQSKPVIITDSGDNVTSGSEGWNTTILKQYLNVQNLNKKVLISNICDPVVYQQLCNLPICEKTEINLGVNYDELSAPVHLCVKILAKGTLECYLDHEADFGYCVLVAIENTPIHVNIGSTRQSMAEHQQFIHAGIDWDEYDIIVVKQGYIFPELKEKASLSIMSLTDGATLQDTARLPFKRIMRPMYPIDNI